ncbi:heme biosynthesis HemY N-terminal domain-containing protein [Hyphomicrobium sp. D-2]|uniref:heme biosynthesis protein HemY n=1 Tax=Hyphomicrobium sp. D-2 TaxID=3041621 RepID=UPI0024572E6A|nr:heme biosynthesis HemY N-terminal domain-containing protein [Hyphomicrobium sp. D-2]MDH4983250.1 heme biosynthesis HemY N-terminal domain-containing protein [Hyphomicrobium sp. D-2]
MLRLIAFLIGIALIATGLAWLADRPGELVLYWQGYRVETSVFRAAVIFVALVASALFIWSILRNVWHSPATVGNVLNKRRQKLGIDALSSGMIALGAGDKAAAMRSAIQARKSLPNEPLTHLLRAQAAQLSGDRTTARRIFEAMLAAPDTEQLGLRGLFLEAQREGEREAALHFAERAVALNPKLAWAVDALFDIQCRDGDWDGALETLAIARKNGHVDRAQADRRRAVLLTAQAQAAETSDPERSLNLATEAHTLAPDLVPAAAIAGRLLASRGNTGRAAKIIQRTWSRAPHPDLATAYAYARIGDSPRDRLERIRQLAALSPNSLESPIAVATAAIEARQFDTARDALEPLIPERMTQRVATLMARIEGEQHADKGRIREWLARAVHAERDPVWTADGFIAERWIPVSPVSGALDAFQWRVPVEAMDKGERELIASKLDELMALGVRPADEQSEPDEPRKDEKPAVSSAASSSKWDKSDAVTVKPTGTSGSGTRNGESATASTTAQASQRSGAQGAKAQAPKGGDYSRSRAPDDPGPDADDHDASGPLRPQSA